MKTILAAWIAAILLLLLASVVLAGPDEDARAALALSGVKPMAKMICDCGGDPSLCVCEGKLPRTCPSRTCGCVPAAKSTAQVCMTGKLVAAYGEFVLITATDYYLLTLDAARENDCKALVMSDKGKAVQMCGHLDGSHSLVVESIGGMGAKADAPSANQQKQIDALPPGTVYQWRRPDGTLSEPKTKPGAAALASTPASFLAAPVRWSAGPQMCSPGGA